MNIQYENILDNELHLLSKNSPYNKNQSIKY